MLLKNNFRPATAGASVASHRGTSSRRPIDSITYSTGNSETEDFNNFRNSEGARKQGAPQRPAQKKKELNPKLLIISAVAAAVVLVLVICLIAFAILRPKHITYEDNAYIAYADSDGKYHVVVNGDLLDQEFEGEVEVIPAADNSFAYVIDTGAEGKTVFLLKGKKLEYFTSSASPVINVLATAGLTPGVIVEEDRDYRLYVENNDERIVKKEFTEARDFFLSADASTVAYTAMPTNTNDGNNARRLYIFRDGSAESYGQGVTPVAVSSYGEFVYAVGEKGEGSATPVLNVISTKEEESYSIEKSLGFSGITAMNVKGNEVLFLVSDGDKFSTYIYSYKKGGEGTTVRLRDCVLYPAHEDPSIAIPDSFKETYMSGTKDLSDESEDRGVYFLNKDFSAKLVSTAQGHFSPDLRYFYYIGALSSNEGLIEVDLTDDNYPKEMYNAGAKDFAVTEKGNLYILDDSGTLRFSKRSEEKKPRIADDVESIEFYDYSNELYFSMTDSEGEVTIYTTREGSEKDVAKLDSTTLTSVPSFSAPNAKKCYAYYYDMDNGWMLFYASNGKSFDMVSNDCQSINGVEIPGFAS